MWRDLLSLKNNEQDIDWKLANVHSINSICSSTCLFAEMLKKPSSQYLMCEPEKPTVMMDFTLFCLFFICMQVLKNPTSPQEDSVCPLVVHHHQANECLSCHWSVVWYFLQWCLSLMFTDLFKPCSIKTKKHKHNKITPRHKT